MNLIILIYDYQAFWNLLIKYLKSDEPSTRYFALNYIAGIKEKLSRLLNDQDIAALLFKSIYSISTSEKNEKLRDLALFLLPLCINYEVTDYFKELVFQKILTEFLQYFPKNLTNVREVREFKEEISGPEIKNLKKYIYLLRCFSSLFHFPQAKNRQFQAYVDQLFVILLNRDINIYIQSEVFYNIHMHYSVTNGNRLRFEKYLREPITKLGDSIISLISLYRDTSSMEDLDNELNIDIEMLPEMPPEIKYWRSQYYAIWKVWFLRPTDNDILLYDCSKLKTAGYALKRKEQLFKYIRQNNSGFLEAKLEVELPYNINTQPSLLYFIDKMKEKKLSVNQKGKIEKSINDNTNEKVSNNTLSEINDSLKKPIEYMNFKPEPININEIYVLEIEMGNKTIIFDKFPFVKKFYLKNKSFNKVNFQFQVYPFESFIVEPSYGELLSKRRVQITVKYLNINNTFNSSGNVNGFLRLRTTRGYPIERINLIGISLPSIKINTIHLDYGLVPPNTERMNFFVIKNLKREVVICNVFILENEYSSLFNFSEKKVSIEKMREKAITLTLCSSNIEEINCNCVITTNLGEIYFVNLKAVCGYPVLINKKVNFGPTDIYYNNANKRILLENNDPLYPISIPLIPSTKEIVINDNMEVVLNPKERKQIKVEFNSMITGTRNEYITINNPITEVKEITVNAISGPSILIPIYNEVGFPVTFPYTEVSIKIPLINVINENAKCLITLPINAPFNISPVESGTEILSYVNTDNTKKTLLLEIKKKSTTFVKVTYCAWAQGLYRSNLNFELQSPSNLHLYSICLTGCCILRSKKSYDHNKFTRIRNFFNNIFDCPEFSGVEPENLELNYKDNTSRVLYLPSQFPVISKNIYTNGNNDIMKDKLFKGLVSDNDKNLPIKKDKKTINNSGIKVIYKNSDIKIPNYLDEEYDSDYDLEKEEIINGYVNNSYFSTKLYNNILILMNISETDQPYHIFISGPFNTNAPLDGVLKSDSYLYIPIYIDYSKFSNFITKENFYYTCYGHITIMDEYRAYLGSVHTLLQGLNNTMLDYEVGKVAYGPTTIDFPNCEQYQTVKKIIYLRNKTNYDIEYDIELINFEHNIYKLDTLSLLNRKTQIKNKKNTETTDVYLKHKNDAFVLNKTNLSKVIKPFEIIPLEVSCLSPLIGSFKAVLKVNYKLKNIFENPLNSNKSNENKYKMFYAEISNIDITDIQFKTPDIIFSCDIGEPKINISNKFLYFGDIAIGNSYGKDLIIINKGIPVDQYFFSLSPYTVENKKLFLKVNEKENNMITFVGKQTGTYNSYIILGYKNILNFMPVSAFCGKMEIETNIGHLIKKEYISDYNNNFWEYPDVVLDFKCVEFSKIKSMEFIIYNKGTIALTLTDVKTSNDNIITWHLVEDKQDNNNFIFNSKLLLIDNNIANKSEIYYQKEIDWDEISYLMERQIHTSNGLIKNNENNKSSLPIIILPNEKVKLILTAWGYKEGKFKETIDFFIDIGNNYEIYKLYLKGDISLPLSLNKKGIDFGICHVDSTSDVKQLIINNHSNQSIKWSIECIETKYNILNANKRKVDKETISSTIHPFKIFPDKGIIGAKKNQIVDIKFTPNITQCDIETKAILNSNIFERIPIKLHGIGGSIILNASVENVDFECCLVGSKKVIPITITNTGLIYSKFSTECSNNCFKADPEYGTIKNGESFIINLYYIPEVFGQDHKGYFKLIPENCTDDKVIYISLVGSSGFPDVEINTKLIDFGYTVWKGRNVKSLEIKNKGTVSAILNFSSKNKALSIEEVDEENHIVIEPESIKKVHVVYIPSKMELLNVNGVFSYVKYKSDNILVNFRATVCQPKLVIDPPDFYSKIDFDDKVHTYNYSLNYGFQPIYGSVTGIGGIGKISFFPKVNIINFGICKINQETVKKVYIKNTGNIAEKFIIRPIIPNSQSDELYKDDIAALNEFEQSEYFEENLDNEEKIQKEIQTSEKTNKNLQPWESYLETVGLKLINFDNVCKPNEEKYIKFIYDSSKNPSLNTSFKLYTKWKSYDLQIVGKGGKSALKIYNINDKEITSKNGIQFGLKPVNTSNKFYIQLKNIGDFGIDFIINKSIKNTFDVNPEEGFIPPNSSLILTILFIPEEENIFKWELDIIWNNGVISIPVTAKSGREKLNITFPESYDDNTSVIKEKDNNQNDNYILNFSPIPIHSYSTKKFYIYNSGVVSAKAEITVTGEDFMIAFTSDLLKYDVKSVDTIADQKRIQNNVTPDWKKKLITDVPAHHYIEIACRYYAEKELVSNEKIYITSTNFYGIISINARGGTILLSHSGTLDFNDINAKYNYSKNITIKNSGSIDTRISFKWTVSSHKHYKNITPGEIYFINSYDNDDPRSDMIKNYIITKYKITSNDKEIQMQLLNNNTKYANFKKNYKYYWELLRLSIISNYFYDDSNWLIQYLNNIDNVNLSNNFNANLTSLINLIEKHRFKRKKNLFKIIKASVITSQSLSNTQSYMRVLPEEFLLPANQSFDIRVDINLEHEMNYIATLHCISNFSIIEEHIIPLIANPKQISILCDMHKIDFKTQCIGESEIITKEFTNVGSKNISYTITSNNEGLRIIPDKGKLIRGETVNVKFIFQPISEHSQTFPIIFQPEYSQPIRLHFNGAGGYSQMSPKHGSTYDFGNGVIGKKMDVFLPIENKGTATLKINNIILYSNGTFLEGPDWPKKKICIEPKEIYNLPLLFKPDIEHPLPSTISIMTPLENYEINLSGVGKDAMIIISSLYLEFNNCIIGNKYEQKITIRNTGDVNYPVVMKLNDIIPGIKFFPEKLIVLPYSISYVIIQFKPTIELNKNILVGVISPFSKNQIRLKLHSGYVKLQLEQNIFDLGMFEANSSPKIRFNVKNVGTLGTHYSVVHRNKYSNIQFTEKTGFIRPNETLAIKMSYVNTNKFYGQFCEAFDLLSDRLNFSVPFNVIGDCNRAIIHPNEINSIDMGLCPIYEFTKKSIMLKNYGKFPLSFKIKVSYPIQCNILSGKLNGNESQAIKFSWMPTGAFVLHSTATILSNAGNYSISLVGKGTLPKVDISSTKIDFGICAINCKYEKILTIHNIGPVKFKWNIQQQNQDFILSVNEGELQVNQSINIIINFTPKSLKCYQSALNLECRGLANKEIQLVGVGGNMKFYISPRTVDMGTCPLGLISTGSFTIKSKGEVTIYSDFSEGKRSNSNNIFLVPRSVVLLPGTSHNCKFDILLNEIGPFEFRLIISTIEKTYKIKIKGTCKELKLSSTILNILNKTQNLVEINPLKSYEYHNYDIFDLYINCLKNRIYDDNKIFNLIENKMNEINYLITGNKKYLKKNKSNDRQYSKYMYKPSSRKRFSVFKTPIVIANIPTFKSISNINKTSNTKFKDTLLTNGTIKELDEYNSENSNKYETITNGNNLLRNRLTNINNDDTENNGSNIQINSLWDIRRNNNNSIEINPFTSNNNLSSNNYSINELNQKLFTLSGNRKSFLNESLLTLKKKNNISINDIKKIKDELLNKDLAYIKKEEEFLTNIKDDKLKKNPYNYNVSYDMHLIKLKKIDNSISSFKERLTNDKLLNLEEKQEFINQIKSEFLEYKLNKKKESIKNSNECNEDDSIIKTIIDDPLPKFNDYNINHITDYVECGGDENLKELLARPLPFIYVDHENSKFNIKYINITKEKESENNENHHKNINFTNISNKYKKVYKDNAIIYIPNKNYNTYLNRTTSKI
ncbi:hypothetical protein LY90DRAFT_678290 [Neocallimastix californiae]|uniref:HYDIN/VesB/CFA65-like Ig-like domain-containing protein n=1 Tax=Neocallimastix californiae TaxID=1754190 RepID=A0A1Y1ZB58_9FUNG|nr:hypothetical protein LY90DRAFT_678290 [Neocallimastix californiae]|eukprot:ORY07426.1 hypothetical protein LY90DRAFT_678290 [Neocallimastix californiae]